VVTWGSKDNGGDLSGRKKGLSGVKKIYSTSRAFAALLWDETVVTWGHEGCGGNSSNVKKALVGVVKIYATKY